jgi:hypothetical protein
MTFSGSIDEHSLSVEPELSYSSHRRELVVLVTLTFS